MTKKNWQFNFSAFDADIVEDNGNAPIAIYAVINNYLVERILVDDGNVMKVLMLDTFKRIGLVESLRRPAKSIYGFANQAIQAKGLVTLLVTLSQRDNTMIEIVEFLVLDQPSAYNAIIG